jgi:hypothetical protein
MEAGAFSCARFVLKSAFEILSEEPMLRALPDRDKAGEQLRDRRIM